MSGPRLGRARARAALAGLVALLLAACVSNERPDAEALSGEQVTPLIVGNTFRGAWDGRQLTMVFFEDGTLRGTQGLAGSDRGRWWIDGDAWCFQWTRYFDALRRCFEWVPVDEGWVLRNVDAFRIRDISGRLQRGKAPGFS